MHAIPKALRTLGALFMALVVAPVLTATPALAEELDVLHPKVVIIGYFETSKAYGEKGFWGEGDKPGELYHWMKGYHLDRRIEVAGAFNPVWANKDGSVIAMKIGPNALHPAVNLTALGLDPRFDLSHSYWLINGIAGTSPHVGTIGDVVWTDFVVNGDVAHEIDAREIPQDWPDGYFMPGHKRPDAEPRVPQGSSEDVRTWSGHFQSNRAHTVTMLNTGLARWAQRLTKDVALPDNATMQAVRDEYAEAAAHHAPQVGIGATLGAETFWMGAGMDAWARRWVSYMTDTRATMASTSTNDAGTMVALVALGKAHRIDPDRVLLLRGMSNFDMPPDGISAVENLQREGPASWAGYLPALEGLFAVGHTVVDEILANWRAYEKQAPSAPVADGN